MKYFNFRSKIHLDHPVQLRLPRLQDQVRLRERPRTPQEGAPRRRLHVRPLRQEARLAGLQGQPHQDGAQQRGGAGTLFSNVVRFTLVT